MQAQEIQEMSGNGRKCQEMEGKLRKSQEIAFGSSGNELPQSSHPQIGERDSAPLRPQPQPQNKIYLPGRHRHRGDFALSLSA